ncbi:MAG: hypothetical protein SGI77_02355 [Pirellulaceae bacterium]|nr:hypothetical protein [Pirellulaceae bacterium]
MLLPVELTTLDIAIVIVHVRNRLDPITDDGQTAAGPGDINEQAIGFWL